MRNQPISSSVLPGIIQLPSIFESVFYFIFPSPTVWVLVSYNEPCMARWFSGCFFEPMSLAWRATNWKRYDYSCWFQKSLVDFLPFNILGFNKYKLPNLTCTCFSFMHGLGKTTPHLVIQYIRICIFFHNANVLEGSHQRRGTFHRGNDKNMTYFSLYRCELWIAPSICLDRMYDIYLTRRIQVCPKQRDYGLPRSIPILFGWDWKLEKSAREGFGSLGTYNTDFQTRF